MCTNNQNVHRCYRPAVKLSVKLYWQHFGIGLSYFEAIHKACHTGKRGLRKCKFVTGEMASVTSYFLKLNGKWQHLFKEFLFISSLQLFKLRHKQNCRSWLKK